MQARPTLASALPATVMLVVGGGTSGDIAFLGQHFPNPTRPNNVLAPFWTDFNPPAGGALRIGTLTDGVNTWIVLDWDAVKEYSTARYRHVPDLDSHRRGRGYQLCLRPDSGKRRRWPSDGRRGECVRQPRRQLLLQQHGHAAGQWHSTGGDDHTSAAR